MFKTSKWTLLLVVVLLPSIAWAKVEFETLFTANIDAPIIDVATDSTDGRIFLLTAKAVLLYDAAQKAVVDRIPLDQTWERIAYFKDDQLLLSDSASATIRLVQFSRIYDIDLTGRAVKGPADAKVTLVVFDDYQCPYCARLEQFIEQRVLPQFPQDLRFAIKQYPLGSHKFSHEAAMAALAAGKQGKFWEFHSQLLQNYDKVDDAKILEIAKSLGLDMERFNRDRGSPQLRELISEDVKNGRAIGVTGTPSVFLNGKRVPNRDLGRLPELITQTLGR